MKTLLLPQKPQMSLDSKTLDCAFNLTQLTVAFRPDRNGKIPLQKSTKRLELQPLVDQLISNQLLN